MLLHAPRDRFADLNPGYGPEAAIRLSSSSSKPLSESSVACPRIHPVTERELGTWDLYPSSHLVTESLQIQLWTLKQTLHDLKQALHDWIRSWKQPHPPTNQTISTPMQLFGNRPVNSGPIADPEVATWSNSNPAWLQRLEEMFASLHVEISILGYMNHKKSGKYHGTKEN